MTDRSEASTGADRLTFGSIASLNRQQLMSSHPLPDGPIANAFESVQAGVMRMPSALDHVREGQTEQPLTDSDARMIADTTRRIVARSTDDAWRLAQLLMAAAEATDALADEARANRLDDESLDWIDVAFVRAATGTLRSVPDGRRYRRAVEVCDQLLARCGTAAELHPDAVCTAAHLRAVYCNYGSAVTWWDERGNWAEIIIAAIGRRDLDWPDGFEQDFVGAASGAGLSERLTGLLMMPDARAELAAARALADTALTVAAGNDLGFTASLLLRLSDYAEAHDQIPAADQIALARTAWQTIDATAFPESPLVVLRRALSLGSDLGVDPGTIPVFPLAELLERFGARVAVATYYGSTDVLQRMKQPLDVQRVAVQLLELDLRSLTAAGQDRLTLLTRLIHQLDGGAVDCAAADARADDAAALTALISVHLDGERRCYAELHAAFHAGSIATAEHIMRTGLDRVPRARRTFATHLKRFVRFLANLKVGAASVTEQVQAIGDVLRLSGELGILLNESLVSAASVVRDNPTEAGRIAERLLPLWDRFLLAGGDEVRAQVDVLGCALFAALGAGLPDVFDVALLVSQMFKGRLTSTTMAHPGRIDLSAEDMQLLKEQTDIVRWIRPAEPGTAHEVDRDELAFAFAEQADRHSGRTSADQVANVLRSVDQAWQRALFEQRVARRSRAAALAHRANAITLPELLAALDDRTALLDLFLGEYDGRAALWVGVYSRDCTRRFGEFIDQERGVVIRYDKKNPSRPLTFHMNFHEFVQVRRLIADEPPGSRPVTREARPLLEDTWLTALRPALRELDQRSYDRLVIWPHGALHYAPLSVMSLDGTLLADRYTVTYTSSLELLCRPRPDPRRKVEIDLLLVAAPDGGRTFGYPSVPSLREQVERIAAITGTGRVLTGAQASVATIAPMIQSARFVHLAAHGGSDPFLPWYQCLYLGDGSVDDRLLAYDLLRADLRDVELLTLSACETALGRFDRVDNQAGLMAALFSAGVRAVVACLWEVRPDPSTYFFVELYRHLAITGTEPVDTREAFRKAQLATRAEFPAYRDWGAFIYIGGW